LGYQDVQELMRKRGMALDHMTVFRWAQRHAPELEKRCRPLLKATNDSYRIDDTSMKLKKPWHDLYRVNDAEGHTIDFMLSVKWDAKALRVSHTTLPHVITVDHHPAYPPAFGALQQARTLPETCRLSPCEYLNTVVEWDYRCVKCRINPGLGCGTFSTAQRTIQGHKAMHMLRKGQIEGLAKGDVLAQNQVINQLFGLDASRALVTLLLTPHPVFATQPVDPRFSR
jgi:IS6 family transposase